MNILSKERLDELIVRSANVNDIAGWEVAVMRNALIELSELRSIVANVGEWFDQSGHRGCVYCHQYAFCEHSPDCPVLRYASYRKESE